VSQIFCNKFGNGAVPPDLQMLGNESVQLPPNYTKIINYWSSNSCAPYAFIICKCMTSTFTYCLQLLHSTCVYMNMCVCLYLIYTFKASLCKQCCTQSAHCDLLHFYCYHYNCVVLMCYVIQFCVLI